MKKICITSIGPGLNSPVDPRFGRCGYFLIVDEKGKLIKKIANQGVRAMRGAGVSAAQIVANEKVEVVITGNIGPNAYNLLTPYRIKIFTGVFSVPAKQAFKMYRDGKLKEVEPSTGRGFGPSSRGLGGAGRGRGRRGR